MADNQLKDRWAKILDDLVNSGYPSHEYPYTEEYQSMNEKLITEARQDLINSLIESLPEITELPPTASETSKGEAFIIGRNTVILEIKHLLESMK